MTPKTFVHLTATTLEFSRDGVEGSLKFDLTDLVKNQEVTDLRLLDKKLKEFLDASGLVKDEVSLVLSPEITFYKILPLTDAKDEKFEIDKFLGDIPFDPPNIEVRTIKTETELSLFAGNKHLFYPMVRILEKYGWKVLSVVPDGADVNFLSSEEVQAKKSSSLDISPKLIILGGIFISLLIILGIVVLVNQNKPVKNIPAEVPLTVPSKIATPEAKLKIQAKDTLKVQVINGTGTAGDAKKVKEALELLGYQNITTDNLEVQNATASAIIYSSNASNHLSEISISLQKIFKLEPLLVVATPSSTFDLQIITGK